MQVSVTSPQESVSASRDIVAQRVNGYHVRMIVMAEDDVCLYEMSLCTMGGTMIPV